MADLNALIAQGVQFKAPPDPFAQYAQMQQMQQGQTANELARYQLSSAQRADTLNEGMLNYMRSPDYKPEGLTRFGTPGIAALKATTEAANAGLTGKKLQGEIKSSEFKLSTDQADKAITDIGVLNNAEEAIASIEQKVALGKLDAQAAAALKANITAAPDFNTWKRKTLLGILDKKDQLTALASMPIEKTDGQKKWAVENNPRLPNFGQPIGAAPTQMQVTPGQQATNDRIAEEGRLNRANAKEIANIRTTSGGLTPEQTDALYGPNGAVTLGKLDPYKVNGRTAKILADAYILNPNTDMNALGSNAGLMRNAPYMARAQTTEMLPEILSNVVTAGKKVNYSDAKFIGAVEQFAKGQMNDPDFISYMTQRNDALLTIAGVMRGNGATDQAHRAEIEAAIPTMSPAALDAWLKAQMTALAPRLKQAAKVTRTPGAAPAAVPAAGEWGKAVAE